METRANGNSFMMDFIPLAKVVLMQLSRSKLTNRVQSNGKKGSPVFTEIPKDRKKLCMPGKILPCLGESDDRPETTIFYT
jgi:hypothetical protein